MLVLIDSGATGNFISQDFCERNGIRWRETGKTQTLHMADGSARHEPEREVKTYKLRINEFKCQLNVPSHKASDDTTSSWECHGCEDTTPKSSGKSNALQNQERESNLDPYLGSGNWMKIHEGSAQLHYPAKA